MRLLGSFSQKNVSGQISFSKSLQYHFLFKKSYHFPFLQVKRVKCVQYTAFWRKWWTDYFFISSVDNSRVWKLCIAQMAVDVTNSAIYHCIYRHCFSSGGLSSAVWCISMGQYFHCSFGQMCVIKILYIGTSTVFTTTAITRWWPRWLSNSVALDEFFSCASSFHQVWIFIWI